MSTTKTPPAAKVDAVHEVVAIELVGVADGFNARTEMDDSRLAELTASVKQRGVIQPLIVERTGDRFVLVAGHRRLEAAKRAKSTTVPVLVYETLDAATRLQIALVENLQREDLTPMDEARGYQRAMEQAALTQAKLAKLTGKSQSHISQRLQLLKLPDGCQQLLATGALAVQVVKPLLHIAAVSAALADACAKLTAEGVIDEHELVDQPHVAIEQLADHVEDHPETGLPFVYGVDWNSPMPLSMHLPTEQFDALQQRIASIGSVRLKITTEDVDAARSYGCLLEFGHQFGTHRYVTDAVWMHDRIMHSLDAIESERAKDAAASSLPATAPRTQDDAKADKPLTGGAAVNQQLEQMRTEQQARREKLDADRKKRDDAITANRQLGINLQRRLGAAKLDRTTMRLLAELLLRQNRDLAGRGIRYTHAEYHQLEHLQANNGNTRTRFVPLDAYKAHEQMMEWVLRASRPEEIVGRLLQALIAGTFADQEAVAQSNRHNWNPPTFGTDMGEVIAKLAIKHLPEHFHERAERMLPDKPAAKKPASGGAKTTKTKAAPKKATTRPSGKAKRPASTQRPAANRPAAVRSSAKGATRA